MSVEPTEENTTNQVSLQGRKKRQTITFELIKKVRKGLERGLPIKNISENEEICLTTVYTLANKIGDGYTDEAILFKKKGRNKKEYMEEKGLLSQILLRDSSYTQLEMAEALEEQGLLRSQSAVSRILKSMEYTRKRLVQIPQERNSERIITERQNYSRQMQFMNDQNLVFLDETGINMNQTRHYGYSPKNVKAIKVVKTSRGKNISTMVAIKVTGVICFEMKEGAFNSVDFISFIENKLCGHFICNPQDVLILDNCRFHHAREVIRILNQNQINYKFLPAYSPQLNPIEQYFSHLKSVISSFPEPPLNTQNLKTRISEILENEMIDMRGFFREMRRFIEKALARHEFI